MRVLVFVMCGAPFDVGKCLERGYHICLKLSFQVWSIEDKFNFVWLIQWRLFFRHETLCSLSSFMSFADLDAIKIAANQTDKTCYKLPQYVIRNLTVLGQTKPAKSNKSLQNCDSQVTPQLTWRNLQSETLLLWNNHDNIDSDNKKVLLRANLIHSCASTCNRNT